MARLNCIPDRTAAIFLVDLSKRGMTNHKFELPIGGKCPFFNAIDLAALVCL